MKTVKKNLIVGILRSIGYYEFEPFLLSFQKHLGEDCELLVHVSDEMSEWSLDCLKNIGNATLEKIPPELNKKYFGYVRFKMIEDHLAAHKGEYAQVLMSDMRDVIIQGDPFQTYANYDSYICYETELVNIGDEPINASWIIRDHGREMFERIKSHTVACAGTLLGTADAMQAAMHELNNYLVQDRFNVHGADQALLNCLVYTGRMPAKHVFESSIYTGVVCTSARRETPIVGDKILSLDGKSIPAVCHQYDRHKSGQQLANRLYRSPDFRIEKRYDDLKSKLDIANAMLLARRFPEALMYLSELAELDTPEWKTQSDRAVRIVQTLTSTLLPQISGVWILQAICRIIFKLLVNRALTGMSEYVLNILYQMTLSIKQRNDADLKIFGMQMGILMLQFAQTLDQKNDRNAVSKYLEMIKQLDCPLSRDYWLLSAKNNRLLGRKDQALEDYKKAIE